jgi:ribose 5-phosphate isomerase A
VRESARRFVVIGDPSKRVPVLGSHAPLPVEIIRYGHLATARRVAGLGGAPKLRLGKDEKPFLTDSGNYIYDCFGFVPIRDPFTLQRDLRAIAGVVETGLFLTGVERAILGQPDGTFTTLFPTA